MCVVRCLEDTRWGLGQQPRSHYSPIMSWWLVLLLSYGTSSKRHS